MTAADVRSDTINDINTTPLIDVMLVLLIMLIITIPIQTHKVAIDLPTASPRTQPDAVRNKVAVDASGGLFLNGDPVSEPALAGALQQMAAMPVQPELQFEASAEARYEAVDRVLAMIKRANLVGLGMIGNERYANF